MRYGRIRSNRRLAESSGFFRDDAVYTCGVDDSHLAANIGHANLTPSDVLDTRNDRNPNTQHTDLVH